MRPRVGADEVALDDVAGRGAALDVHAVAVAGDEVARPGRGAADRVARGTAVDEDAIVAGCPARTCRRRWCRCSCPRRRCPSCRCWRDSTPSNGVAGDDVARAAVVPPMVLLLAPSR